MTGTTYLPAGPDQDPLIFLPCAKEDLPHIIRASQEILTQIQLEKGLDLSILEKLLLAETLKELPDYTKLVRGGQLVGWYHLIKQADCLELDDLNINPPFRCQGLGSQILERVQALARDLALPLQCTVLRDNAGALRLYSRMGFVTLSEAGRYVKLGWPGDA